MRDFLGNWLARRRRGVVKPYINGKLLDVGCGFNHLVRDYPGEGVGVDIHQWGTVDVLIDDITNLPFDDNEFDTATLLAVLNQFTEPSAAIQEIGRVVSPKGFILITMITPFVSKVWRILRSRSDSDQVERKSSPLPTAGFTNRQMRKLLLSCDFEVVKRVRFMFGLNSLYICRRVTAKNAAGKAS